MSEQSPSFADLSRSDLSAEEFAFSLERARDGIELRTAFANLRPDAATTEMGKDKAVKLADATVGALWRLGLDMEDGTDDRIAGIRRGADAIRESDQFGPGRNHPTRRPETAFWSSYRRVLSGLEVSSPDRLQLVRQEDLVQKPMLHKVARAALAFTAADEYTRPHRYGRKAYRAVTDPQSRYWGVAVSTDTYPGMTLGSSYDQGPNISIVMPTGLFSARSVGELKDADVASSPIWQDTLNAGYVEPVVSVQSIHLGMQHGWRDNVDTPSGYVEQFLEHAENA